MKKWIKTSIKINATPQKIWDILLDFEKYPEWNPFINSIKGKVDIGSRIEVKLAGMTFKPDVLQLEQLKAFEWKGKLGIKGLFDGSHGFFLTENSDGSTTFEQNEFFSGILVGLLEKKLDEETKPGFEAMNVALKQRAEQMED